MVRVASLRPAGSARVHGPRYRTRMRGASSAPDVRRTVGGHVCLPGCRSSCVPSAFFGFFCFLIYLERGSLGALNAARECAELGHFNMAAVQQRTVLLRPARRYWCQMSGKQREVGGGQIQPHKTCSSGNPASLCLSRSAKRRKKPVCGALKIFPSSSPKLKRRMQLLVESCALSTPVRVPTLSCLLTSYFPGWIQSELQM